MLFNSVFMQFGSNHISKLNAVLVNKVLNGSSVESSCYAQSAVFIYYLRRYLEFARNGHQGPSLRSKRH